MDRRAQDRLEVREEARAEKGRRKKGGECKSGQGQASTHCSAAWEELEVVVVVAGGFGKMGHPESACLVKKAFA